MSNKLIEYRPPRIAMALLVVAAALHVLLPLEASYQFSSIYLSSVLVSVGFVVMIWAWWQFKERRVAICPTDATEQLITDGIYRHTRNPMYLGIVMMLGGIASFFGTLPFYAATIIYFIVLNHWFCRYEEEKLTVTFGHSYEDYRSKVRRWI